MNLSFSHKEGLTYFWNIHYNPMIAISPRRNITDRKSLTHLIENLIEKLFCINAFIKTFIKSNLKRKKEGFQLNYNT